MKICVLVGSPKAENSITFQTVLYWQKLFPGHSWEMIYAGRQIKKLEKDFQEAAGKMEAADLLLFCYPVYTFIAPSQLHRFIELMKIEISCGNLHLAGKFAAQVTTSKHFYDVTALEYVKDNCQDMGMKYLGGLSEDMEDLLHEKGQKEARQFFRYIMWRAKRGICDPAMKRPKSRPFFYVPAPEASVKWKSVPSGKGKNAEPGEVVIVTDLAENPLDPSADNVLSDMIADFRKRYPGETRVVDLAEYPFAGGCLGCFHCAADGVCIYKDGFDKFLREQIQTASAIVYAFQIRDHAMGARFKMYDDRQFCNGHRTVTMGMPMGYLVCGNLDMEPNLRMILEARADVGGNFLAGIAMDGKGVADLAAELTYALRTKIVLPQSFYGVGGMKIFRDLIFQMRGLMREDHRFYKKHKFYDFPQNQPGKIAFMYLAGAMMNNPKLHKKLGGKMTEGMLMPYRKVLEEAERKH